MDANMKPAVKDEKLIFGLGRNVFFAGVVSFFMDVSSEMIYPLVPLFLANVLGVDKTVIGLIEGVAEATASLLKVFSGWFSDRIGRRRGIMVVGYAISVMSRPFIALAGGWHGVMTARFCDRFGKGVRTAPRDAIIAESTEEAHLGLAFGFHRAMDTLGAVIGPFIAFVLLGCFAATYRRVFWLSMIPGVIAVAVIAIYIREKRRAVAGVDRPRFKLSCFDRRFRFFVLIATIFALGNSSDVFLVLRAGEVGISAAMIPVLYLLFNLVYSVVSGPAGMAADRFGRKRIILLGFVLFAGLYWGFATVSDPVGVWWLFGAYGVFMGLTEGAGKAFVATIIPPDFKATAFGVYTTATGLATLPASIIGGWLWEHAGPVATFYFGAAAAACAAGLFVLFMIAFNKPRPVL